MKCQVTVESGRKYLALQQDQSEEVLRNRSEMHGLDVDQPHQTKDDPGCPIPGEIPLQQCPGPHGVLISMSSKCLGFVTLNKASSVVSGLSFVSARTEISCK